jgi:HEAT repeat protein
MSFFSGLFGPPDLDKLEKNRDIEGLIKALNYKPDEKVVIRAIEVLGNTGGTRAVEPLIRMLKYDHWRVRVRAAESLGNIGDASAVQQLAIVSLNDRDHNVRSAATDSLWKLKYPTIESLILASKYGDEQERRKSLESLVGIDKTRAVEPLISGLKDKNSSIRGYCASALGTIGDIRAVEPLIDAVNRKDSDILSRAIYALGTIGDTRAIDPLISAVRDGNKGIRMEAVKALEMIGDTRAVAPFIEIIYQKDPDTLKGTIEALGTIGDARAIEPLISFLKCDDEEIRIAASDAIMKIYPKIKFSVDEEIKLILLKNQDLIKGREHHHDIHSDFTGKSQSSDCVSRHEDNTSFERFRF